MAYDAPTTGHDARGRHDSRMCVVCGMRVGGQRGGHATPPQRQRSVERMRLLHGVTVRDWHGADGGWIVSPHRRGDQHTVVDIGPVYVGGSEHTHLPCVRGSPCLHGSEHLRRRCRRRPAAYAQKGDGAGERDADEGKQRACQRCAVTWCHCGMTFALPNCWHAVCVPAEPSYPWHGQEH